MSNIFRRLNFVWLIGPWLLVLPVWICLYWGILDTRNPISHVSQSVTTTVVTSPGKTIDVIRNVCVSGSTHALVHASFTDGVIYHVPPFAIDLQPGCHTYHGKIAIPPSLVAGSYVYHERIDIQKNPLTRVSTNLPPIRLNLRKSEHSSGSFLDEPPDTTFTNNEDE